MSRRTRLNPTNALSPNTIVPPPDGRLREEPPQAKEFGKFGLVHVRYGKAKKGSPPKRRSVLIVFDWTPEVLTDWLEKGHQHMDDGIDLFPANAATWSSLLSVTSSIAIQRISSRSPPQTPARKLQVLVATTLSN